MAEEIKVPSLGQSVPEAIVGKWLKQLGDEVAADEAVVELETDKINMEVTAFRAGTLLAIREQTGASVQVGQVLGVIGAEGEAAPAVSPPRSCTQHPPAHRTTPKMRVPASSAGGAPREVDRVGRQS